MVDKNKWNLDTGCSNHMLNKKELFVEFDEFVHGEIKFGNNNVSPVYGKEKFSISLKNWSTIFISYVFYVLGLHHNLLSVGQLFEKKYDIHIRNGTCTIFEKKKYWNDCQCVNDSKSLISIEFE